MSKIILCILFSSVLFHSSYTTKRKIDEAELDKLYNIDLENISFAENSHKKQKIEKKGKLVFNPHSLEATKKVKKLLGCIPITSRDVERKIFIELKDGKKAIKDYSTIEVNEKVLEVGAMITKIIQMDENTICVGTERGEIKIYDIQKKEEENEIEAIKCFEGFHKERIVYLEKIGDFLISACVAGKINILDIKKNEIVKSFGDGQLIREIIKLRENSIAVSQWEGITIWDIKKGEIINKINAKHSSVLKLNNGNLAYSFNPDIIIGTRVYNFQSIISSWDPNAESSVPLLVHDRESKTDAQLAPLENFDNNHLVSTRGKRIEIWNIHTNTSVMSLIGHDKCVESLGQLRNGTITSMCLRSSSIFKCWDGTSHVKEALRILYQVGLTQEQIDTFTKDSKTFREFIEQSYKTKRKQDKTVNPFTNNKLFDFDLSLAYL